MLQVNVLAVSLGGSSALALKSHLTESDASALITRAASGTSAAGAGS